jgi:type III pantothenate kinase
MLLAIDVGNTTINLGVFDGDTLILTWRLTTGIDRSTDEYGSLLFTLLQREGLSGSRIRGAALCSVVPPLALVFRGVCQDYLGVSPMVVEPGIKTGVRICMDNPREVGPDRIVNAVAAHHLYGKPVIVIDFGTATTFDVVSKEGDYLGGAIAPGIGIASEALFTRTAMLPRIELSHPKHAIGRNTVSAMQSGIIFGYSGLVENIIKRVRMELGCKARVVATGGYVHLVAGDVESIEVINADLSLVGLRLIYEMNKIGE